MFLFKLDQAGEKFYYWKEGRQAVLGTRGKFSVSAKKEREWERNREGKRNRESRPIYVEIQCPDVHNDNNNAIKYS